MLSSLNIRSPRYICKPTSSSSTKDKNLQLWIEHGARISARSAVLISRTIAAHTAAMSAQSVASIESFLPPTTTHTKTYSTVSVSPSVLSNRRQVRELRRRFAAELESRENSEKRARELKEAQIRELHEQNERERILRTRAAEQREADARASRPAEKKRITEREGSENTSRVGVDSVVMQAGTKENYLEGRYNSNTSDAITINPVLNESTTHVSSDGNSISVTTQKRVEKIQTQVQKDTPMVKRDPDALQQPIFATGKDAKGEVSDKILGSPEAPEDISRVVRVWNTLCNEAEPFRRDPSMKKPRLEVKKQINLMVNQIAASVKQVTVKITNLCQILRSALTGGGPGGEAFAMKEIAQRLVSEADGSVALSRTAAFAVGSVIVGVTAGARDPSLMRDAFLGAFYKHCIYTMPAYGARNKNEPAAEYKLRIGYKDSETPESYMERSCGCVGLFAAVLQTEQVLGQVQSQAAMSNPFSLDLGWTWLARIANREQRAITPAITYAFLETAGYRMSKRYRRQFAKLMAVVQQVVVMKAARTAPRGSISRMDTLLDEFVASGCIFEKPPEGSVLPARDMEFL